MSVLTRLVLIQEDVLTIQVTIQIENILINIFEIIHYLYKAIPTCRCFKYFSGNDCEIKSQELIAMKRTASSVSGVAIAIVSLFYVAIFSMDYFKYIHVYLMSKLGY